jgi:hypothetical protein
VCVVRSGNPVICVRVSSAYATVLDGWVIIFVQHAPFSPVSLCTLFFLVFLKNLGGVSYAKVRVI